MTDYADSARAIIDRNAYMVLGTADADGTPWASPVWFATAGYSEFVWVSKPGTRHSRNLAAAAETWPSSSSTPPWRRAAAGPSTSRRPARS